VRGGSTATPSLIEIQSALDVATRALATAATRAEEATFALARSRESLREHGAAAEDALSRLHESDARMAAVAEQLGQLGSAMRAARSEQERTTTAITLAEQGLQGGRAELADLEQRLAAAAAEPADGEVQGADGQVEAAGGEPGTRAGTQDRDRLTELADLAAQARSRETEVRLSLRTQEERVRAVTGRAESLDSAARSEIAARERDAARRDRHRQDAAVAAAVRAGAAYLVERVRTLLAAAGQERDRARTEQVEGDASLGQARGRVTTLGEQLRELTDSVHQDEVARAEQRLRIEQLQTRAVEELGIDPEVLVEEFGPHQLIMPIGQSNDGTDTGPQGEEAGPPRAQPFVRQVQEQRLRSAERTLLALGRVNPLALEEFSALEERHKFLTEQVEDLRRSKQDLLAIVKEVDERVQQVFATAFEDTAAQFEQVFSRLFPGGEGRLTLTDPDDMLATGIEVEARPPGKRIKRLSLLSGGERSLTAVALLVAIFKARPSPFYVMDEVEAALDDTNLGRLLTLFEELRDSSQLIVITHQKRTMEVADALYGTSMRGDGVTTLVSQRMRDVQPQPA
jgi:chromosome segregation protein